MTSAYAGTQLYGSCLSGGPSTVVIRAQIQKKMLRSFFFLLRSKCSVLKICSDWDAQIEVNAQMKMLSLKKMLSWKCSAKISPTFLLRFSHTRFFQPEHRPPPIGRFLAVFFLKEILSFAVSISNLPVFLFAVFLQIFKSTRFFFASVHKFQRHARFLLFIIF